ncbi:CDP-alcohol phosphatidyltransferase family protein [Candidatus Woesearchaeota archaeon]|nr:CDP-alcohol phosphatidyltransferase family protein [Candidatus Woesearchaeota archaeon]
MKEKFWNLPNALSLSRALLAVVVVILVIYSKITEAIVVFIIAALTDAIDGFLAKKDHKDNSIGIILDPICDKILIISAVISLIIKLNLELWKLVIFARDIFIALGFVIVLSAPVKKKINLKADIAGKTTTFLQISTIISIVLLPRYQNMLIILVLISSLFTIINYGRRFIDYFKTDKNLT